MLIDKSSPHPLNTHAVAYTGLIVASIGILTPIIISHTIGQHWAIDILRGIHEFGAALTYVGLYGTYKGRPNDIPQK